MKFKEANIIHQEPDTDGAPVRRLLDVGRLIIKNEGRYKASGVEAYIENISSDGEARDNFIPVPLVWTHGQLNEQGPTVRDIYPNQTVYLDVFNHIYDPNYVGESTVELAVAAGHGIDSLSKMNAGVSKMLIRLYQESGQVNSVTLKTDWDMKSVLDLSISDAKY